jgi:hypothetical protein
MDRDTTLTVAALVLPAGMALAFPQLVYMARFLVFCGIVLFVVVSYRSMFRQDRRGIFLQCSDPDKLLAMKPNKSEMRLLKVALCCLADAIVVVLVSGGRQVI